jgi:small subunit ribosomal protein S26e
LRLVEDRRHPGAGRGTAGWLPAIVMIERDVSHHPRRALPDCGSWTIFVWWGVYGSEKIGNEATLVVAFTSRLVFVTSPIHFPHTLSVCFCDYCCQSFSPEESIIMTVKRRNHGRNKHNRGHVKRVRCVSTGKAIPKDKAIKRFIVRNIVDASSLRDIKEMSAYPEYQLPKLYLKMYYCVEAAVHQRIVRGRSKEDRRIRTPPQRFVRT